MKRILALWLIFSVLALLLTSCSSTDTIDSITYIELGIPSCERYPEGIRARNPWDMAIFGDKLYIGSGDYDKNSGPVDMWCYDMGYIKKL